MNTGKLCVSIKLAWWFRIYFYGVVFMCLLTGMAQNDERFAYWCKKSMKVKVVLA